MIYIQVHCMDCGGFFIDIALAYHIHPLAKGRIDGYKTRTSANIYRRRR